MGAADWLVMQLWDVENGPHALSLLLGGATGLVESRVVGPGEGHLVVRNAKAQNDISKRPILAAIIRDVHYRSKWESCKSCGLRNNGW
uniref:Macaca fascicularis brain cDNA clone: QflA-23265, similar to human hypothetical protein LOC346653 (LOC346653), mRNA, RefSeq: XM_379921.1 n=1 Tax=Macaca fascicularis TaxID=9541 RepID=I7GP08_MACFA|nr:unnamed protein product [Macaca fascicularis]